MRDAGSLETQTPFAHASWTMEGNTLSVRQVISFIVVERQTKLAFVGTQVVAHEVRIVVEVNGLHG